MKKLMLNTYTLSSVQNEIELIMLAHQNISSTEIFLTSLYERTGRKFVPGKPLTDVHFAM